MSMATRLSDLDDQKPGVNIQTEGHTITPPSGWNSPEYSEAFGSAPSHSPSWFPARKPTPDQPETRYCLEMQVTSTKDGGSNTITSSCLAGASCGRYGMRWQIWPDRGSSDRSRPGCSVLWMVIIKRRTELGQGMRHHVHAVRSYKLGWQTSPT